MIEEISKISREAGREIMFLYNRKQALSYYDIKVKKDSSPVTIADLISHRVICSGLRKLSPNIPIYSEENFVFNSFKQDDCNFFWLVDPLDGTKEFLYRRNEFTVNIALIQDGIPVMGVIYVPVIDVLYAAYNGKVWKEYNGVDQKFFINVKKIYPPVVVVSRFHLNCGYLYHYLLKLGKCRVVHVGSSLKFCMIAEGVAQLYPRFSAINLWDIAAGHIIATTAGAEIHDWFGNPLVYKLQNVFVSSGFEVSSFY